MEDISEINKNYKLVKTNKNKDCYLEKGKYILNLHYTNIKNENTFRCKYYNDKNIKCPAFVKIFPKGTILDYNKAHTYIPNQNKTKALQNKTDAKKIIDKFAFIFDVKGKDLYNSSIKKAIKRKSDDISDEKKIIYK